MFCWRSPWTGNRRNTRGTRRIRNSPAISYASCASCVPFPFQLMPIMIAISIIPVPIMVPVVIVLDSAPVAFPITLIILATLITRSGPASSLVWSERPVALMPFPVVSYRIPIAINPHIIRSRASRKYANHTWRRRWTDSDSNRNLAKNLPSGQECNTEQNCCKKPVHVFRPPDLLVQTLCPKIKKPLG
jgi:hypothetical protein